MLQTTEAGNVTMLNGYYNGSTSSEGSDTTVEELSAEVWLKKFELIITPILLVLGECVIRNLLEID